MNELDQHGLVSALPDKSSEPQTPARLVFRKPTSRISLQHQHQPRLPSCCVCDSASPHTPHPSVLAGPHALHPLLLLHSFFAPLGHWRWASSQWRYSTDCSASSSNMQCSLCVVKSVPAVLRVSLCCYLLNCFVLSHTGSLLFFTVWLSGLLGRDCATHLLPFFVK